VRGKLWDNKEKDIANFPQHHTRLYLDEINTSSPPPAKLKKKEEIEARILNA